jgi:hypothetical protein
LYFIKNQLMLISVLDLIKILYFLSGILIINITILYNQFQNLYAHQNYQKIF